MATRSRDCLGILGVFGVTVLESFIETLETDINDNSDINYEIGYETDTDFVMPEERFGQELLMACLECGNYWPEE